MALPYVLLFIFFFVLGTLYALSLIQRHYFIQLSTTFLASIGVLFITLEIIFPNSEPDVVLVYLACVPSFVLGLIFGRHLKAVSLTK